MIIELIKNLIIAQNKNLSQHIYSQELDYKLEEFRDLYKSEFNEAMDWAIKNPNLIYVF